MVRPADDSDATVAALASGTHPVIGKSGDGGLLERRPVADGST